MRAYVRAWAKKKRSELVRSSEEIGDPASSSYLSLVSEHVYKDGPKTKIGNGDSR